MWEFNGSGRERYLDVTSDVAFYRTEGHAETIFQSVRLYSGVVICRADSIPKRARSDSEASRKSVVGMALSLAVSIGTSANDFLRTSKNGACVDMARY